MKSHKEASRHNARRMTDAQLAREIRQVSEYPEQPPIRVEYLAVLREEAAKREAIEDVARKVAAL